MATKDKRLPARSRGFVSAKAGIVKAQPFAWSIVKHLHKLIHQACPDADETLKWSFASFDDKGPLSSIVSFKQHALFGFRIGNHQTKERTSS